MKRKQKPASPAFAKLSAGLADAIAHQRGERVLTVRDEELHTPPRLSAAEVAAVRASLHIQRDDCWTSSSSAREERGNPRKATASAASPSVRRPMVTPPP